MSWTSMLEGTRETKRNSSSKAKVEKASEILQPDTYTAMTCSLEALIEKNKNVVRFKDI